MFNLKKKGERIATFPLEKIFGKDNIFASMISNVIGTVGKAIEGIASNVQKGNSYIIGKYLFFPFSYIYIYKIFGKYFTAGKPEYLKKTNEKKRKKRIGNTANYINPLCKGKTTITTTKKKE